MRVSFDFHWNQRANRTEKIKYTFKRIYTTIGLTVVEEDAESKKKKRKLNLINIKMTLFQITYNII